MARGYLVLDECPNNVNHQLAFGMVLNWEIEAVSILIFTVKRGQISR
jgi:hypothetical protein